MTSSCEHLKELRTETNKRVYASLCEKLVYPSTCGDRRRVAKLVYCSVCGRKDDALLQCCLSCAFFGCVRDKHLHAHHQETGHPFGLSIKLGQLYCHACGDIVYDREFENIRREVENTYRKAMGFSLEFAWNPAPREIEQLKEARKRTIRVTSELTFGLRGLLNLGHTCFMNSILQALTHTPLLRDYFLSDQHRCPNPQHCLMCEMGRTFQEFYGGGRETHVPYEMLHLVWTHARHLAGYEQQDAHEFFIAALDILHRHSRSSHAANGHDCQCIIDRIFTGRLQSDVTCQACSGVSTTLDKCYDISLDLATASQPTDFAPRRSAPSTLQDCLQRFTHPEHLGSAAKIGCERCESAQESTKQMTLRKLPIVACFHLKRFEQSSRFHKKISSLIRFPLELDMTPYTTRHRDRSAAPEADQKPSTQHLLDRLKNKYALFAVVNHHGFTLDGGHYTCYIRQNAADWFKCDDDVITRASLEQVLNSEGYLLFYHKQFLDYD